MNLFSILSKQPSKHQCYQIDEQTLRRLAASLYALHKTNGGVKKPAYFQSATKKATKIDHEVALNKEQWFKLKTKFPVLNQALPSEGYAITSKLRSVRTTLPIITTQEPDETSKKIYVHTLLLPLTESH